ncbi:MAG: hypothetical protein VX740_09940, partial [Pseudomonadota bacterium]|nr:hypothetical protein [Pseudomonadota bacterium]
MTTAYIYQIDLAAAVQIYLEPLATQLLSFFVCTYQANTLNAPPPYGKTAQWKQRVFINYYV